MTVEQVKERVVVCESCELKPSCEEARYVYDSEIKCPIGKWGAASIANSVANLQFGDAIKHAISPVIQAVDRIAGTDLSTCGACAKRREQWNFKGFTANNNQNINTYK